MFKRRLAVLGAVGVLVLTALGGSAMADEAPPTAPGAKVTCTTSDGKTFVLAERMHVAGARGEVSETEAPEGIAATRTDDGQVTIEALPEGTVPDAVPALPAVPAEGEGFTADGGGEPADDTVKLEWRTAQKAEDGTAQKAEDGTTQKAEDGSAPVDAITVKCESK